MKPEYKIGNIVWVEMHGDNKATILYAGPAKITDIKNYKTNCPCKMCKKHNGQRAYTLHKYNNFYPVFASVFEDEIKYKMKVSDGK